MLVLLVTTLYGPSLSADFVWDARAVILSNPYVHGLGHWADVLTLRVMHLDMIDNNRPFFLFSAMLDWALWGGAPFGFHLTNLLWHLSATLLLFALAREITRTVWPSFFAALLFAVHPVNCEAVAEISYRKDLIAAAAVLAALNLAARFQPRFSLRNILLGAACVACLLVGVATKENAVVGPLLLTGFMFLHRSSGGGGNIVPDVPRIDARNGVTTRLIPTRLVPLGWLFLIFAAVVAVGLFMVARFTLPPWPSIIFTEKPHRLGGSLLETLKIQPRIWVFYFRQILWPENLCADYNGYSIRSFPLGLSLFALGAVLCGQLYASAKNRVVCFGVAFFLLPLLTVSNFIPIYRPMADRFLYLPMVGVALLLAALGARLQSRAAACAEGEHPREPHPVWLARTLALPASGIVCGIGACLLATATFHQEKIWQNSLTLWTETLARNPFSFTAANNLAEAQLDLGDWNAAIATAKKAVQLSLGKEANPFATAAVALGQLGRMPEAREAYRKAVELDPRYRSPEKLVKALVLNEKEARQLELIASPNL